MGRLPGFVGLASRARSLWWNLAHRAEIEASLHTELREYVELLAAEYRKRGLTPDAAWRQALVDCGGTEQVKEATRDAWVGNGLATAARELRFALRSLRRSPTYVVTAILTLGLAVGSVTALFTIVKGSLLRPLPAVTDPGDLVSLEPMRGSTLLYDFSYPDFRDLRDQSTTLSGLAAFDGTHMVYRDSAGSGHAWVSYVSGEFFSVLGVKPVLGRLLTTGDAEPGASGPVAVVGYDFWQQHLGGSAAAIGAAIRLDGYPLTVIGVAPKGFVGAMSLHPMEIWVPLTTMGAIMHDASSSLESRRDAVGRLIGRLAPGRTIDQARHELSLIATRLAETYPEDKGKGIRVYAGAGMTLDERADALRMPGLLAAAAALLLLIACANVANLSLIRVAARRRELATRLALGASRTSLIVRLLLESGVLAAGAALFGLVLAYMVVRWAAVVHTVVGMSGMDLSLDWRVLGISIGVCIMTVVLVSIAPAVHTSRVPVGAVLKDGGAGGIQRRSISQRALVTVQVAASLMLLVSSAVVFGAVRRALATNLGFDAHGVTMVYIDPHEAGLDSARQLAFYRDVLAKAKADPSIDATSLASTIPPAPWDQPVSVYRRGEAPPEGEAIAHGNFPRYRVYQDDIYPGTFALLRIPLLVGRDVSERDDERAPRVAIVSKRMADELWLGENPIGKLVVWPQAPGRNGAPLRVIGVVGNTRHNGLTTAPAAVMYTPYVQRPRSYSLTLVLRGRSNAEASDDVARRIVGAVMPGLDVTTVALESRIASQVGPQRRASAWIGGFGVIALLLAAIGLYGVVAQGVLQRTRELALRAAMGASPHMLLGVVMTDGMRLTVAGVIAGAAGSALALRALRVLFNGLDFVDPRACAVAAAVLIAAALAATYLPAKRAARLDVMEALRSD